MTDVARNVGLTNSPAAIMLDGSEHKGLRSLCQGMKKQPKPPFGKAFQREIAPCQEAFRGTKPVQFLDNCCTPEPKRNTKNGSQKQKPGKPG